MKTSLSSQFSETAQTKSSKFMSPFEQNEAEKGVSRRDNSLPPEEQNVKQLRASLDVYKMKADREQRKSKERQDMLRNRVRLSEEIIRHSFSIIRELGLGISKEVPIQNWETYIQGLEAKISELKGGIDPQNPKGIDSDINAICDQITESIKKTHIPQNAESNLDSIEPLNELQRRILETAKSISHSNNFPDLITSLQNAISSLDSELPNPPTPEMIANLKLRLLNTTKSLNSASQAFQASESEYKSLQTKLSEAEHQLSKISLSNSESLEKISNLRAALSSKEAMIKSQPPYSDTIKNLEILIENAGQKLSALEDEKNAKKAEISAKKLVLMQMDMQRKKLENEVEGIGKESKKTKVEIELADAAHCDEDEECRLIENKRAQKELSNDVDLKWIAVIGGEVLIVVILIAMILLR